MAKAVASTLNGAGSVVGTYASAGEPAVYNSGVPVTVTFTQAGAQSSPPAQNK